MQARVQGGVRARAGREAGGSKLARANYPNEFRGLGLFKVRLSPSNVAGEKKLHLPEGSKASFGGVFLQFLGLLSGSSAYLYVEVEKKPRVYVMIKRSGEQLPAGISVGSVCSFNITLI